MSPGRSSELKIGLHFLCLYTCASKKYIKIRHTFLFCTGIFYLQEAAPQRYELTIVLLLIYKVETQPIAYKITCTRYMLVAQKGPKTSVFVSNFG